MKTYEHVIAERDSWRLQKEDMEVRALKAEAELARLREENEELKRQNGHALLTQAIAAGAVLKMENEELKSIISSMKHRAVGGRHECQCVVCARARAALARGGK